MIEVFCILATILVAFTFVLPALSRRRPHSPIIKCVNNLKNVGLAYRIYATDNNDLFPFQVSTNLGGTRELTHDIAAQFRILSNELSTPKIIVCPRDYTLINESSNWINLHATNISYYVGLNASETNPASIIAGDAGFSVNGSPTARGSISITTNDVVTYPKKFHFDKETSCVATADGTVQQIVNKGWPRILQNANTATNTLVLPY